MSVVAIVGRPNVGKSTLFNRLIDERKAIVDDQSGVTRDRHYGICEWSGRSFTVIDTGGYVQGSDDIFEKAIRSQVKIAIDEADILLFMVDVTDGITPLDEDFALILRKSSKPVLIVANKVDHNARQPDISEFYNLGIGEVYGISSANGSGTGELLDEIVELLPEEEEQDEAAKEYEEKIPRIAVIGRPNVGKSSIVNALIGEERNIVTDIAGTTRDTIHTRYKLFNHDLVLIDTAGIRRKTKVEEDIEFYSVMRSIKALEHCDVVVLVIDAEVGMDSQDLNLVHLAVKNGKGLMVVVNKWDLIQKDHKTAKAYETTVREKLRPFSDVPVLFTSAIEKQRILKILEVAVQVSENRARRIPTHAFNDYILEKIENYPPPSIKGKFVKIKFARQLPGSYPKFAFFCNLPQYINDSYKRYIENKIREEFDFSGVPISVFFRKK